MDEMDMGGGEIMMMAPPWTLGYAALIFLMWAIMMVAMMLPSAAPTILLVTALGRNAWRRGRGSIRLRLLARLDRLQPRCNVLQFGLDRAGVLSETMAMSSAGWPGSC